jgi:hypothetical protein
LERISITLSVLYRIILEEAKHKDKHGVKHKDKHEVELTDIQIRVLDVLKDKSLSRKDIFAIIGMSDFLYI